MSDPPPKKKRTAPPSQSPAQGFVPNMLPKEARENIYDRLDFDSQRALEKTSATTLHQFRNSKPGQKFDSKAERQKLEEFADILRMKGPHFNPNMPVADPQPLDAMIERLKFTPYPRRKIKGIELYNASDPHEAVRTTLGSAIGRKLRYFTDLRRFLIPDREEAKKQIKSDWGKLVVKVFDAVFLPSESANAPGFEDGVFIESSETVATCEANTHENAYLEQLFFKFKYETVNGRGHDSVRIVLKQRPDDQRSKIGKFKYGIEITATQNVATQVPTTLEEFVGRLRSADTVITKAKKSEDGLFYSDMSGLELISIMRAMLVEGALFYPESKVMVRGTFVDLAVADRAG